MEKTKRCCNHCHQLFLLKRNPQQHYCSQKVCQNARKHKWRRYKRANDPDYHANQHHANQEWQRRHRDYWKAYRKNHSDYTKHNREQTRLRKQKRRLSQACFLPKDERVAEFAKCDALEANIFGSTVVPGTYQLIPVAHPGFAKSDALIVRIAVVARD